MIATFAPLSTTAAGAAGVVLKGAPFGYDKPLSWAGATIVGACPSDATQLAQLANVDFNAAGAPSFSQSKVASNNSSLYKIAQLTGATMWYNAGYFGQGVGVALIDTGVRNQQGLDAGNVVHALDISIGAQADPVQLHDDGFGHGTHLASIIAGRDDSNGTRTATHAPYSYNDPSKFTGIAPGAKVYAFKVGDYSGAVDATQVAAAIDYVVEHRNQYNPPIRVMNLSVGFDAGLTSDYKTDPLSKAVQSAWDAGIVVVAATGNGGKDTTADAPGVASPAFNKSVIAVGGYDQISNTIYSDSQSGSSANPRQPDLVAPARSVMALSDNPPDPAHPGRALPSTQADEVIAGCDTDVAEHGAWTSPELGPNGRFILGSGTSQAAAIVTGAVALMYSRDPYARYTTPDFVKRVLRTSASGNVGAGALTNGQGILNMAAAYSNFPTSPAQNVGVATGGGSWDAARGQVRLDDGTLVGDFLWDGTSRQVEVLPGACIPGTYWYNAAQQYNLSLCVDQPNELRGNVDVFGEPLDPLQLAKAEDNGTAWVKNADGTETYMGSNLTVSTQWTLDARTGLALKGRSWSGRSWSGRSWSDDFWSGRSWSGRSWSGRSWSGRSWSDGDWSGRSWSGRSWSDHTWADQSWN